MTTPIGGGIRSLNVALRQDLDLFACVRPVRYFTDPFSKEPENRHGHLPENGRRLCAASNLLRYSPEVQRLIALLQQDFAVNKIRFPKTSAIGIKPHFLEGSQRLIAAAIYALANGRIRNASPQRQYQKFTEGGFKIGVALAETKYAAQTFTMNQYATLTKEQGAAAAEKAYQEAQRKEN